MKNSILELPVPSINYHLWEPCNMRCKFCFATFQDVKNTILPKGHLPKAAAIDLVKKICSTSVSKITFAGGEPTLCPWLYDLISVAKKMGKTTMIVTNGTRINDEWIEKYHEILDWIALSIDSVQDISNLGSGRAVVGKKVISRAEYISIAQRIKQSGIRLKINTVVHSKNRYERLNEFIKEVQPERWKIFQVLPIQDQNDGCINDFIISDEEFQQYLINNSFISDISVIKESNDDMTNSYLMIDPAGRFYQNDNGRYQYSSPILDVGVSNALEEIDIDVNKFINRGGRYKW